MKGDSTVYELLLFLHVLGSGVWLGGSVSQLLLDRLSARDPEGVALAYLRTTVAMGRVLFSPAAVVVLLTGIGLVVMEPAYDFADVFISVGFAMVIIGMVLGMAVFGPFARRAIDLRANEKPGEARPVEQRLATFGAIHAVLLVVTIGFMVWKVGA